MGSRCFDIDRFQFTELEPIDWSARLEGHMRSAARLLLVVAAACSLGSAHAQLDRVLRAAVAHGRLSGKYVAKPAMASFTFYRRVCERYPALSNFGTLGLLGLCGDALQQSIEGATRATYDVQRTARFVLFRIAFVAPLYSVWYPWLERFQFTKNSPAAKVFMDCFVSTPLQHAALFSTQAVLYDGLHARDALERCATVMPRSLPASWAFWIPVQALTFTAVPPPMRVTFISAVALVWNAVLSGINHASSRT
jgi:hypothetical protein